MTDEVILIRFGAALGPAFLFGLARQRMGKPIGFGTFIFLAMGSCALAMTALEFSEANPLPLLGAIVTGIGFLGAGALFRTSEKVVGFTSAATIWAFAVFGMCVGVGEYLVAGLIYVTICIVMALDLLFERLWIGGHQKKVVVEVPLDWEDSDLREVGLPGRYDASLFEVNRENNTLILTYSINRPKSEVRQLLEKLHHEDEIKRVVFGAD
ncbi:MAG: MgtC/SapB family protein [Planctomycetota bacterium]